MHSLHFFVTKGHEYLFINIIKHLNADYREIYMFITKGYASQFNTSLVKVKEKLFSQ